MVEPVREILHVNSSVPVTRRNTYVIHNYKSGKCLYEANSLGICWCISINDNPTTKEKRTDKTVRDIRILDGGVFLSRTIQSDN